MRRSNFVVLVCMIAGMAVLGALGMWQLERLAWKEQLIERVDKRLEREPVPLETIVQQGFDKQRHEYLPVVISGVFDHPREVYFFTTGKDGEPVWHVHTPLFLENGDYVIVNRGAVPFDMKEPDKRLQGQLTGSQEMEALLRFPLAEKPVGSLENDMDRREFYWRGIGDMARAMRIERARVLPVIADLRKNNIPGNLPQGGTTIISFPNNHLQYAFTWFGLALTLLGVGGYFLFSRGQVEHD